MMKNAAAAAELAKTTAAVDISDDGPSVAPSVAPPVDRLEMTVVPLAFTAKKAGAGVTLDGGGKTAASDGKAVGSQLADTWMAGGRNPLIWTCAIALEEVSADTVIGIVGRNYFPSEWDGTTPLTKSTHAVVLRCGDGKVSHKGKATSFILRPLTSGAKLNLTIDLQKLELTVDLLGKDLGAGGQVVSSVTVEGVPGGELTLAVGFAASGAAQRVRIVGCKSEKPDMVLTGKFRKDLWDEDNIQTPLALNVKGGKDRGPQQQNEAMAMVAASLQ